MGVVGDSQDRVDIYHATSFRTTKMGDTFWITHKIGGLRNVTYLPSVRR